LFLPALPTRARVHGPTAELNCPPRSVESSRFLRKPQQRRPPPLCADPKTHKQKSKTKCEAASPAPQGPGKPKKSSTTYFRSRSRSYRPRWVFWGFGSPITAHCLWCCDSVATDSVAFEPHAGFLCSFRASCCIFLKILTASRGTAFTVVAPLLYRSSDRGDDRVRA
jgi:hypothetical protein